MPPGDNDGDGVSVDQDLRNRGVTNNQYGAVVVFHGWGSGYGYFGAGCTYPPDFETGFLGAPATSTGYSTIPNGNEGCFIHELLHSIRGSFVMSGYSTACPDPDSAAATPGDFGNFEIFILRNPTNDQWLGLNSVWGTQATATDADQDGLPDSGSAMAATESTFGSSTSSTDTDSDGLSDLAEYYAGERASSSPTSANSDGDDITSDGKDKYPIYNLKTGLPKFTPLLDGNIESGWGLITSSLNVPFSNFTATVYGAWDANYFYMAFHPTLSGFGDPLNICDIALRIDANNDGSWHGCDNYYIELHQDGVGYAELIDWTTYEPVNRTDLFTQTQILYGRNGMDFEIAIPRNTSTGMTPDYGKVFGFLVNYTWIGDVYGQEAWQFERGAYVDLVCQPTYYYGLDTEPSGWSKGTSWAFGAPSRGTSTHNYDPSSAHSGNRIYGYRIGADYENSISSTRYLKTAAINCSGMNGTTLKFWRWLGVDSTTYDKATIQVSNDNSNWTTIWTNPASVISDSSWQLVSYDISQYADWKNTVYIRWGMGTTNSSTTYPGWSIDDISIEATK
jgi:hypothetical protein